MGINKRIEEIMNIKNHNYRSFGLLLTYSDTQIRNIILGKSIPKVDFIQKISQTFPEVNLNWVINGEGSMYSYGNLNDFKKEEILDFIIHNNEEFRAEPKIDAITALFNNYQQQRELKKMYDKLDSYEDLLKKAINRK